MNRGVLAVLLAGVAGAVLTVAPARADAGQTSPPDYTSADSGVALGSSAADPAQALDAVGALFGAGASPFIRVDLDWWYVEGCRGCQLAWDRLDPLVDGAVQRGMRVLLILDYSPPWANGHDTTTWFPLADADWQSIVDRTVAHFGAKVLAYEVWNEPNQVGVFGDFDSVAPVVRYWQLVRIAHQEIHAACPACTVVAGGSAAGVARGQSTNRPEEWLTYAYANGYGADFDAVALHPYSDWDGPAKPDCGTADVNMFGPLDTSHPCGELTRVRSVMLGHGDGAKKIWGTEIGYPVHAGIAGEVSQARDDLLLAVRMWRLASYTGPLLVYTLHDPCTDGADPQCVFGLLDAGWQPKQPLYGDLATALRDDNVLRSGQRLIAQSSPVRSTDGRCALALGADGNLVLTRDGATVWSTHTGTGATLINQSDGNLVLYAADGTAVWSSGTWSQGPSQLVLQNDGNLVLYGNAGLAATWASDTAVLRANQVLQPGDTALYSAGRRYRLSLQTDGNLVLYRNDGVALWSSGTKGAGSFKLINQDDGNLVIYRRDGAPIWSTGTWGKGASTLVVQGDGDVVLYRADGTASWATGT